MSTLSPDEKLCPYCAETIKAAAVKCRYCQSDLTVEPAVVDQPLVAEVDEPGADEPGMDEPEADALGMDGPEAGEPGMDEPEVDALDEEDGPVGADPEPDEASLAPTPSDRGEPSQGGLPVVAALLVLCLVLGGALGYLAHRSRHPHLGIAPNGQVTDGSFRNAAMSAASDAATKALSYSWKTFDQDRKNARALMGPKLAKQYDQAMDQVAAQTASSKLTLKATVLSVGVLSAEEHEAKVLLFVNTLTTREGSKKQQLDQNRVVMDLTRKDGDWTVTRMDAF